MTRSMILAGSLAQRPAIGGHTWVFLQYLLGFRRLGWDVLFLDRLEPDMCVDNDGRPCPPAQSANLGYFTQVMNRFGLGDSYALLYDNGTRCLGMARDQLLGRVQDSSFLLNVMGFITDEHVLECAARRVFLDIDPGFGQMWADLGLHDLFARHTDFVTVGENVGRDDCLVPALGKSWITIPPPVVLDEWPQSPPPGDRTLTSIATWRGSFGPIEYHGTTYGLRVHEFRKFASLPLRTGADFQLAIDIDASEERDFDLLRCNAWDLVNPRAVAGDPDRYRDYIRQSAAEFMVAKSMYVKTRSGWLSDRSVCYLATGRPVIAQDTGLEGRYSGGEGLLLFSTLEEAADAVQDVLGNYDRHAQAASRLARECFDSDNVLHHLVGALGLA